MLFAAKYASRKCLEKKHMHRGITHPFKQRYLSLIVPENGEVEMEVKLEVKMEVEMEIERRSKWMRQFYYLIIRGRKAPMYT